MEQYEKIRCIGQGAFGKVFLCDRRDGKKFVMKEIAIDMLSAAQRQAAVREVKLLKMLSHPNIIGYLEDFIDNNNLCIIMEYAQGGTLADFLQDRKGVLLDENEVLQLIPQLLVSLHHLHTRQILHRDLKTQNILMNRRRNICKLSDFGISKVLETNANASTVLGTPNYMAPEVLEGKSYNTKSDIWALGCIVYEMLALRRAFEAEVVPAVMLKVVRGEYDPLPEVYSVELRSLVTSMLQLSPEKRSSVPEMLLNPIIVKPFLFMLTDLGSIKCDRPEQPISIHETKPQKPRSAQSRIKSSTSSSTSSQRGSAASFYDTKVLIWGGGVAQPTPLLLPSNNMHVKQVSAGADRHGALMSDGRFLLYEDDEEKCFLGPDECQQPTVVPRFVKFWSSVTISLIACGGQFVVCVTDRGILMTFGSGANGCLGHGNFSDSSQPKIVDALVSLSVTAIACGYSHVLALSAEDELYSWGRGEVGRLGTGSTETQNVPRKLRLPDGMINMSSLHCSMDASAVVCRSGRVFSCGGNHLNKLGISATSDKATTLSLSFTSSVAFPPVDTLLPQPFSLGLSHSALISGCRLFCYGSNKFGQLGNFQATDSVSSVAFDGQPLERICCGDKFTVAVTKDQRVWTWGKDGGLGGKLGREGDGSEPTLLQFPFDRSMVVRSRILSLSCFRDTTLVAVKSTIGHFQD